MSNKSSGRLVIPQWGVVSRVVTAFDLVKDEYDVEVSRTRSDLTNSTIYFTVKDAFGNIVIQKTSSDPSEILKLDQVDPATTGQARVFFVEADTAALVAGDVYWFDCWSADASPNEEPIVDRGKFIVSESVTHILIGPSPSIPIAPAPQIPQVRSFIWVAPSTGDDFDIDIPGTGMVDANYHVGSSLVEIPSGGSAAICLFETALKTSSQFNMKTSGVILIGTTFTFHTRGI